MVLCSPVDTRCEQVLLSDNEEMGPELGEHATGMEDGHHSEGSFDTLAGHGQQDLAVGTPRCLLSSFIASISTPLEASVLGMPATVLVHEMDMEAPTVPRSVRFAKQHPNGANMEQLAKEAVARRLGSQLEETCPSERLRQDYMGLLDGPLTDQAAAAIDDLVFSVQKTKKKKKKSGIGIERQMPPVVS